MTSTISMEGCGGNGVQTPAAPKGALVAYFSRAGENYCATGNQMLEVGHTARLASFVASHAGAPLFEIKAAVPYCVDYQETVDRAKREWENDERPAMADPLPDLTGLRVLYLGYPVWCGTIPKVVSTFLDAAREAGALEGVVIVPFCTQEGSRFGNSLAEVARLAPKAILAPGFTVAGIKAHEAESEVASWLSAAPVRTLIEKAIAGVFTGGQRQGCGAAVLCRRTSLKPKYLQAPAPSFDVLEGLVRAAMRVPDHKGLLPYRFSVIDEAARGRLGDLYAAAARAAGADDEGVQKARSKAKKGPMIIAFIVRQVACEGVTLLEETLTAGAALGQFMQALSLEGWGGIVLSGSTLEDEALQKAFCGDNERVAAWITVGTPAAGAPEAAPETRAAPLGVWQG